MKFAMFFMAEYANMITVSVRGDAAVFWRCRPRPFGQFAADGFHNGPVMHAAVLPIFWFVFEDSSRSSSLFIWVRSDASALSL